MYFNINLTLIMENEIYNLLLLPQTKSNRDRIVNFILDTPKKISELMECFFSEDNRLSQKASWPMTISGDKKPQLLLPYLKEMLNKLDEPVHDSLVRNTIRVFQVIDIPEDLEGDVYDKCFDYLCDPKIAIAIRVFSMTVLSNIALKYPDLKEELIRTIELYYPQGSVGFKSRARKEIKRLKMGAKANE